MRLLLILSLFVFASCDSLTGGSTGANDLVNILNPVDGEALTIGGVEAVELSDETYLLNGTASDGGRAGHHFKMSLELADGEQAFFTFFSKSDLTDGVELVVKRVADDYFVSLKINDQQHNDYKLNSLTGFETINLMLDVHNDHTNTHVLIWDEDSGQTGDSLNCTFNGSCLYNTADFEFDLIWGAQGRGKGINWGVKANKDSIRVLEGPLGNISNV